MKYAIVDFRISSEEEQNLIKIGAEVIKCPPCKNLYKEVCGHPDMLLHFIDNSRVIIHKDMDKNFIKKLNCIGLNTTLSKNSIKDRYPEDIILNALNLPDLFVHNLKYTDPVLLNNIKNKKLLNVKQGYTKCSTAIVNNTAVITSDTGISDILKRNGIDVLKIPPGNILLPNFNYGFIGGCCGTFKNYMTFFGDLNYYIYGKYVINFLKKHNTKPIFLKRGRLIDRGSIFFV